MGLASIGAAVTAGIGTAGNALDYISGRRALTLPRAGELIGDVLSEVAMVEDAFIDDWRVRLSLPTWPSFRGSPVLQPLADAGGLIFPYTPSISISSSANYQKMNPIHSNFAFQTFQHSEPGEITINAPMNVEDQEQGLYWIAALHYCRSVTKMFSGYDPKAGNPPPIVMLNGYGSYVFNNVPVVVKSFSTQLTAECDYIPVNTNTSLAGVVGSIASGVGSIASAFGASGVSDIADEVEKVATLANAVGAGISVDGGIAYVPTKSSFTITVCPAYSRTSARKFSLDNFVAGAYLNNYFGYV
jgi:hypothetical protein